MIVEGLFVFGLGRSPLERATHAAMVLLRNRMHDGAVVMHGAVHRMVMYVVMHDAMRRRRLREGEAR